MVTHSVRISCVVLSFGLLACAKPKEAVAPVCALSREKESETARAQAPTNAEFVRLIFGDKAQLGSPSPNVDCTGGAVQVAATPCDGSALAPLPAVAVGDREIVTRRVSPTEQIVWLISHSDGTTAEGPVALVERREKDVVVRVRGILRAGRERPKFRIVADAKILVVESERCASSPSEGAAPCPRTARLLVREGGNWVRLPVRRTSSGACFSGPEFELSASKSRTTATGWRATLDLTASWEESSDGITIHESVAITEVDPTSPQAPSRRVREAANDRTLTLGTGALFASDVPLFDALLAEDTAEPEAPRPAAVLHESK